MAAVHFAGIDEVRQSEESLVQLRQVLTWPANRDFHFADCSDRERRQFYRVAVRCPLTYFVVVVEKTRMMRPTKALYLETAEHLVRSVNESTPLHRAKLVFDRYGGPTTERNLRRRLLSAFNPRKSGKKKVGQKAIDSLRAKRARGDPLIQVADMLVGAWRLFEEGQEEEYVHLMQPCLISSRRLP